jgi:hypothetical protein
MFYAICFQPRSLDVLAVRPDEKMYRGLDARMLDLQGAWSLIGQFIWSSGPAAEDQVKTEGQGRFAETSFELCVLLQCMHKLRVK